MHHLTPAPEAFIAEQAAYALLKPAGYVGDDRAYTTHAPFLSLTGQATILDHVNFTSACEILDQVDPAREDWFIEHARHWAHGRTELIFVAFKRNGAWTQAWRTTCAMACALMRYPVLDEDAYDAARHAEFAAWWESVIVDLAATYTDDTEDQVERIAALAAQLALEEGGYEIAGTPTTELTEIWDQARDQVFGQIAHEHIAEQIDGQGALTL